MHLVQSIYIVAYKDAIHVYKDCSPR